MKFISFKNKNSVSALLITTILFSIVATLTVSLTETCKQNYRSDKVVDISGRLNLPVEVADTAESRQMGLSTRDCIDDNHAMLFVFDNPDLHGFWMKDMKFSIDIVWLDQDKRVVDIKQDVSPATYPEVFYPSGTAKYVLETNPGLLESVDVTIGSQLSW